MTAIEPNLLATAIGGAAAADRQASLTTLSSALDDLKRNQTQPTAMSQMLPLIMMMKMRG